MKQIEATILGQSYMLACPPGGEQLLQQAVAIVDREMSAIRDAGRVKARERIAVLTALNLAYLRAEGARAPAAVPASAPSSAPSPAPAASPAMPEPPRAAPVAVEAAQPASSAAHGAAAEVETAPGTEAAATIERLIARLDAVLGDDGRLL